MHPVRGATVGDGDGVADEAVSIHAPRVGRDRCRPWPTLFLQSFNPRAPCGARRPAIGAAASGAPFQSTRPVRGATPSRRRAHFAMSFQSTRPVRGATLCGELLLCLLGVSIHAPRAGRDRSPRCARRRRRRFNPRAPCGARRACKSREMTLCGFQSTRPVRGATGHHDDHGGKRQVSIHAPRAGRDMVASVLASASLGFNPRAPCGARPSASRNAASL